MNSTYSQKHIDGSPRQASMDRINISSNRPKAFRVLRDFGNTLDLVSDFWTVVQASKGPLFAKHFISLSNDNR